MIDIDISLDRGSFNLHAKLKTDARVIGLFGPSGSGKSTLLMILAGLLKPSHGYFQLNDELLLDTANHLNIPSFRRNVGVVFQESRLFPHMTVQQNLLYGFKMLKKAERRFTQEQIVDLLEIGHLMTHKPDQLSGGQRQRVALGRALLASPKILLLDEPLAALDVRLKSQILPFLRRVKDEIDIPMVYVSHAINEILYLTQQIAVIDQGKILASGNFHEVMHDVRVLSLATSLGLENTLQGRVIKSLPEAGYTLVACGIHHIHVPFVDDAKKDDEITISVSASNIAFATHIVNGITIQNQLLGKVSSIEKVDHRVIVSVTISEDVNVTAEVSYKSLQELNLQIGDQVYCLIKTQSIQCDRVST